MSLPVLHRLIIRHPDRTALLAAGPPLRAQLPSFESDDRHTAEVDYINAAARERLGLTTTVLRSLRHDLEPTTGKTVRLHELELHGAATPSPPGFRWCDPDELPSLAGDDREVIAEWLAAFRAEVIDGREWTVPGWFDAARAWIAHALRDTGSVRELVQLRAWPSSCVILVRTAAGDFYFKAVAASLRRECSVTAYLGRHARGSVPELVASDSARRWMLMHGVPGRKLEDVDDIGAWERSAAMYAKLQWACSARADDLRALGCPLRSLATLAGEIAGLANDATALQPDGAAGLSAAEIGRFRSLVPDLERRCEELAAYGVPLTLEHGDLWPGNFLVDGERCVLIDWEDAGIGHPFFSLAPLMVGLKIYQRRLDADEARARIEHAYLTAFRDLASPERLQAAVALAAPLGFIEMALRYRRQSASVVRLHPWMREVAADTVRLALGHLAAS